MRYASVVGDIRLYVEIGVVEVETVFWRRIGRSVGVERQSVVDVSWREKCG